MNISIRTYNHESKDLERFNTWLKAEWGEIDAFESEKYPNPILAFDEESNLVGGLSFTNAPHPIDQRTCTWINAVFVSTEYRGFGVATQLIHEAEIVATDSKLGELLVFTEWPRIYSKMGWGLIDDAQGVLRKKLGANA